jgi:hypothetical protein
VFVLSGCDVEPEKSAIPAFAGTGFFLTTLHALAGGFFEISRIRDEENRAASNA